MVSRVQGTLVCCALWDLAKAMAGRSGLGERVPILKGGKGADLP